MRDGSSSTPRTCIRARSREGVRPVVIAASVAGVGEESPTPRVWSRPRPRHGRGFRRPRRRPVRRPRASGGRSRRSSEARPLELAGDRLAGRPERLREQAPRLLDRREGPEAVDHADPEPTTAQERAFAAAPCPELRCVRGPEGADVVAAVVVDHEEPSPGRSTRSASARSAARTPRKPDHGLTRASMLPSGRSSRSGSVSGSRTRRMPAPAQPVSRGALRCVEHGHVPSGKGPERLEGARDLPFHVEGRPEALGQRPGSGNGRSATLPEDIRAGPMTPPGPVPGPAVSRVLRGGAPTPGDAGSARSAPGTTSDAVPSSAIRWRRRPGPVRGER